MRLRKEIDDYLIRVEAERQKRRQEDPLKYATWHKVQGDVLSDTRNTVAALGGNWSGKTQLNALITASLLQGTWVIPDVINIPKSRPLSIWSISDPLVFADALQSRIKSYLPSGWITNSVRESQWNCDKFWQCKNGNTIRFLSWKKENMEGAEIDVALFDEPPPEDVDSAVHSRLRGILRRSYYFFTPLGASSHLYDKFQNADKTRFGLHNMPIWLNCECLAGLDEDRLKRLDQPLELAQAKHKDGCRCNGGYKTQKEIHDYLEQFRGLEREAREWGEWMFMHRRIFPNFSRDKHVVSKEWMYRHWNSWKPRIGNVYVGLDPHSAIPDYMDISVVMPDGSLYQIAELPSFINGEFKGKRMHEINNYHRPTKEVCEQLVRILKSVDLPINDMVIDPRFGARTERDYGLKVVDQFNNSLEDLKWTASRFRLITNDKDDVQGLEAGHRIINDALYQPNRLQPGHYMMMWSEFCENGIYSFENFRTEEDPKQDGKAPSEKPQKKFKHPPDAKRYIFMTRPRFVEGNIDPNKYRPKDFRHPTVIEKAETEINYAV